MPEGTFVESIIENQKVLGADSGTLTVNLPTSNYLQGLLLRVQNVNGSTSNGSTGAGETIQGDISKIEVIGDGVTLFSTSGRLARKFEHFDTGDEPPTDETQAASAVQWAVFPIKFGRHAQDKELLVPAHMLSNLQLKVTWSFTDSTTVGYTTSESNAKIDVIARYLYATERSNTAFLKKVEVWSKTPASTGTEEATLPIGAGNGRYRRIMIYCYEVAIEDGVDISDFSLKMNDAQTLIEDRWDTRQIRNAIKYNAYHTKTVSTMLNDADTYNSYVSRISAVALTCGAAVRAASATAIAGDRITIGYSDLATPTVVTTDAVIYFTIRGQVVSHAVMLDLGTDNLADSLYVGKDSGISTLKLKMTVAAAGGATSIITEQLVSF